MIDLVRLKLRAGNGGDGRVSFRREKYVPKGGPDGGNGGNGGNIILKATHKVNTLQQFVGAKRFQAEHGQPGGDRKKFGQNGADLILEVPVGTTVWLVAENRASKDKRHYRKKEGGRYESKNEKYFLEKEGQHVPKREADRLEPLYESGEVFLNDQFSLKNVNVRAIQKHKLVSLDQEDQTVVICEGGKGGRGNDAFKSASNTTPLEAEYGAFGEAKIVFIELKLLADVGLVGFPNAGKSTLLSVLTQARPEVASYPFTTLQPQLGVMSLGQQVDSELKDVVIADIPGLIEAAHQGKGLGFDFLRHIEGCKGLLYVLALDEAVIFDQNKTDQERAALLIEHFRTLSQELSEYHQSLEDKAFVVGVNKSDLYSDQLKEVMQVAIEAEVGQKPVIFSAATSENIDQLRQVLVDLARV